MQTDRSDWTHTCQATSSQNMDQRRILAFLHEHFEPYRVNPAAAQSRTLITGYYEPLLQGSLTSSDHFRYPVHRVPEDMLRIELGVQVQGTDPRGRLENRRVLPYWTRRDIDQGKARTPQPIAWVADPVDLFFLHVQGSGRIQLTDGSFVSVGFADHNGHPYRSIGRVLIDEGAISREEISMQAIRAWLRQNPERSMPLLHHNPRYIFFRELDPLRSPLGSAGVVLTPWRSVATDPASIPTGTPVFLQTRNPLSDEPITILTVAQDRGAAIKGPARIDLFFGFGQDAELLAGHMKEQGNLYIFLPKQPGP
ncbi:murein transglycosylase A [Desulfurispirillum indicum]|uniref:murein transglycosylase A n=1 Tax=Desulfurispirillum indicum TaxID=936456 RepID=UPI0001C45BE0|nr:MltA domain-containing protein [Desulfurispirillum indicum]